MTNPFFEPSTLPFEMPPFESITDDDYRPAFERGMADQRAQIDEIVGSSDEATFDNTIVALERSGQLLDRVAIVFFNKTSSDGNDTTTALEEELAPVLAAHTDSITLDRRLYERIRDVYARLDEVDLDAESRYLVERYHAEFIHSGAALADHQKAELCELNARLSTLNARFEKNLISESNDLALVVDDVAELDGLSPADISGAARAATDRGLTDRFLLPLTLPTGQPSLSSLTNRGTRERVMAASRARGNRGGDGDTARLVVEISRLRAERAHLIGFDSHAAWVTSDETAGTPEAVMKLLSSLASPAARNARREQADLAELAGHPIEAHDWSFYSEKVRAATYDVDLTSLRPYFEAERVLRDGVFFAATRLYGVTFRERDDIRAYHPDVRVFQVDEADGTPVGLYTLDLYTRDSKRGGAWMNSLVSQSDLLNTPVIVTNNLNVPKPADGDPTLLTYDEVSTLFHEFGHALHGLFARVTYPKFSGTSTFRDFVEFPSQVNEMWMLWPEVLAHYAVHFRTGEPIPGQMMERLHASEAFGEGFATSEYLAAAVIDQAWHAFGSGDEVGSVSEVEHDALTRRGLDNRAVPSRYGSTYFQHIFSDSAYDAGYYSYIWSEVLDADTVQWFRDSGGLTRANGDRFRKLILEVGGSKNPLAAYREFRGRDARIQALLDRRGLN